MYLSPPSYSKRTSAAGPPCLGRGGLNVRPGLRREFAVYGHRRTDDGQVGHQIEYLTDKGVGYRRGHAGNDDHLDAHAKDLIQLFSG